MPDHQATVEAKEAGREKSSTPVTRPPPVWVKIGQWVFCMPSGRYAVIEDVIEHGTIGFVAVRVRTWQDKKECTIEPYTFLNHWKPCEKPVEPRTSWERHDPEPQDQGDAVSAPDCIQASPRLSKFLSLGNRENACCVYIFIRNCKRTACQIRNYSDVG